MKERSQLAFSFPRVSAYRLVDFLPAESNRRAFDAVLAWPDWPATALLVYGPSGSGRTHLAHIWCERSGGRYLQGAEMAGANPLELLAGTPGLAIDDADRVPDRALLLQLYNLATESGNHLMLTAGRPARQWATPPPDLLSRLNACPAVPIDRPDDPLLAVLLVKQFEERGLRVEPGLVDYLVPRMDRSFAAVRRLVELLDRTSLESRRSISPRLAREALARLRESETGT